MQSALKQHGRVCWGNACAVWPLIAVQLPPAWGTAGSVHDSMQTFSLSSTEHARCAQAKGASGQGEAGVGQAADRGAGAAKDAAGQVKGAAKDAAGQVGKG